jgi:hypothetical protein
MEASLQDCQNELAELLKNKPEALSFIKLYVEYANLVDDIVDEKDFQNSAKFLKHSDLAETVHTHPYWIANFGWLRVATLVVHNDYADSVIFEHSDDEGKKQLADSLRIAAIHLVLLVVYNELGYDAMRAISPKFRHALWKRHKNEGH